MDTTLDRRRLVAGLGGAALAGAAPLRGLTATQDDADPQERPLAERMAEAAAAFLEDLPEDARARAAYAFDDEERVRWHWTTPGRVPRNGLPLADLDDAGRERALALLRASLSEGGHAKALDIVSLQADLGQDPTLYFVTVFGDPTSGGDAPWGWRFEGHHLSRHFTVVGDRVSAAPFFHGAWPTETDAGLRAMEREEEAARELVRSLLDAGQDAAVFAEDALQTHVTQNEPEVAPLDPVGIPVADLDDAQRALVLELVDAYLDTLPAEIAAPARDRALADGLEALRFGWAGGLDRFQPHYYRLAGPTFLLEFDNSRNGATHIHSVWRDFEEDFGRHLLA